MWKEKMRGRRWGDRCEHMSEMKLLTQSLWSVTKHFCVFHKMNTSSYLRHLPFKALAPVFQFTLLIMQEIHKGLSRNEQQCACGRKPVFPSQMTQRGCCCCDTHEVSWPNRNIRLQRCGYASITHLRSSLWVCSGFYTDICFPASCCLCEPVFAEDQGRQHRTCLCHREHKGRLAQTSSLFLGTHILANPDFTLTVHECTYHIKSALQQFFLKVITVETKKKGNLLGIWN